MRGIFLTEGPSRHVPRTRRVRDFMTEAGEEDAERAHDPESDGPALKPNDTLEAALRAFDSSGHERLAVIDPDQPDRIAGWASQVHALRFFNRALVAASEEEHHH